LTRAAKPAASKAPPRSFAWIISNKSGGRGRLPTCVVRMRSVLRFIGPLPIFQTAEFSRCGRTSQHVEQIPVQRENNREFFRFPDYWRAGRTKTVSDIKSLAAYSRRRAKREFIRP
jgi:hypothetical protein